MRYPVVLLLALTLFATVARAEIVLQPVEYQIAGEQMNSKSFRGWLAYDSSSSQPRPGVLIAHEWWGLTEYAKRRAQDYAKLGYVAFALDMYGAVM